MVLSEDGEDLQPEIVEDEEDNVIEEAVEKIKIGRKVVEFRVNDPIFKLTEPVSPLKDEI